MKYSEMKAAAIDGFMTALSPRAIVSWLLYAFGDLAYIFLIKFDGKQWCEFWYPIYNKLMLASVDVQGDGRGPWRSGPPE